MKSTTIAMKAAVLSAVAFLAVCPHARAGLLYAVDDTSDRLVTIDTDTFDVTDIGPLGVAYSIGGLAYDPNSDTLYLVNGGIGPTRSLFTVDRNTGAATLVGAHGVAALNGLAFDSTNNVLYGSQALTGPPINGLFTLDAATGVATLVGTQTLPNIDGLAYDSLNDRLVGVLGFADLYEIDRTDASLTLLLDGPGTGNPGLAYDPDKNLFWAVGHSTSVGALFSYDPTDGFARTTHLSDLGALNSLAYVASPSPPSTNPVPEPASLALLGIGLVGTGLCSARRCRERSGGRNNVADADDSHVP